MNIDLNKDDEGTVSCLEEELFQGEPNVGRNLVAEGQVLSLHERDQQEVVERPKAVPTAQQSLATAAKSKLTQIPDHLQPIMPTTKIWFDFSTQDSPTPHLYETEFAPNGALVRNSTYRYDLSRVKGPEGEEGIIEPNENHIRKFTADEFLPIELQRLGELAVLFQA
jgi:hypothetical protein